MAAALPGVLEGAERHLQAPLFAGAQGDTARLEVIADRDRVVPDRMRVQREVLQHDHGVSRSDLCEEICKFRLELDRDKAVAARRREHLDLQASVAIRKIDLVPQRSGPIVLLRLRAPSRERPGRIDSRPADKTEPHRSLRAAGFRRDRSPAGLQLRRGAARKPQEKDARRR